MFRFESLLLLCCWAAGTVVVAAGALPVKQQLANKPQPLSGPNCAVPNASKVDCRQFSEGTCTAKGCCWVPAGHNSAIPWCFFPAGYAPCKKMKVANSTASPPFSASEQQTMLGYFLKNLDIDGQGGVVASPDRDVGQGGSYYYAWERDGALSMRVLLDTQPASLTSGYFAKYVQWVLRVQNRVDPHGIDVRTEPKYLLPEGKVYPGGWCRPQTDGPALRATTLMRYAQSKACPNASISEYLWTGSRSKWNGGAIQYDLDWVAANWTQMTCDLWEEVRSDNFFWNRMSFLRAMNDGSKFAGLMGDEARAKTYASVAGAIRQTLAAHWNGKFIQESENRKLGASVIPALNDGQDELDTNPVFPPSDPKVASTIQSLFDAFCTMFPINNAATEAGIPGQFLGRYEGDTYQGGNPWILLTAQLGESFYRGAQAVAKGAKVPAAVESQWRALFDETDAASKQPLAPLLLAAGDGCLLRIRHYVKDDGFHLAEQIDKNSGKEISATDLTWSYATVFKALRFRDMASAALAEQARK